MKKYTIKTSAIVCVSIICFFISQNIYAQVPKIKWWYNTYDFSAGQAAAKDIDNDGKLEVVFGCYRNDSSIYALNGEDGTLLWKYNASAVGSHGCNDVAPIIYDVDNNGTEEVIVPGSCNPKTFCFNGATGTPTWIVNTRGSDSPPTIADIDNDGKPEILHGEFLGYVMAINAENGTQAWEILVDSNSWIQTAPTIVDLDNNGQLDFVVATWNFNYLDSVFAFRGDNQARLWAFPIHDHIYHGSAVADLDNDGKPEIVIGSYNDTLYCLNGENGTVNWKYAAAGAISGPVSLGDIDNDGSCDVVFGGGGQITALTGAGALKWSYTVPNGGYTFRGVALADITNDSYLDVIFGTYNTGVLYALNGNNGSLIWNLDLRAHYGDPLFQLNHAPVVADFDNDDTLDVFVVGGYGIYSATNMTGNFGRAYMVSAGKGNGPNWLMFQRDIRRQSSLCFSTATNIKDENVFNNESLTISPNPSNSNIKFSLKNKGNYNLRIYNSSGKLVHESNYISTENIKLNINDWPSGIYFSVLKDEKGVSSQKKFVVTD